MSSNLDRKIELTTVSLSDANDIFNLINNNRGCLIEWMPWIEDIHSMNDIQNYIKRCLKGEEKKESLTMHIRINNEIIGIVTFSAFNWRTGEAFLEYFLDKKFQGNGIVSKSCFKLIYYAFEYLKLESIRIHCQLFNHKASEVAKRLFFRCEVVTMDKTPMAFYVMSRDTWNSIQKVSNDGVIISEKIISFAKPTSIDRAGDARIN